MIPDWIYLTMGISMGIASLCGGIWIFASIVNDVDLDAMWMFVPLFGWLPAVFLVVWSLESVAGFFVAFLFNGFIGVQFWKHKARHRPRVHRSTVVCKNSDLYIHNLRSKFRRGF